MKKRRVYYISGIVMIAILLSVLGMVNSNISKKPIQELESNFYNVKNYGAVGDGTNDDTEAVRKALAQAYNNNGTVYFPAGTYLITQTINIARDDSKTLAFKGEPGAVLVGAESLKGHIIKGEMKYNFYIYNIAFEHRGSEGSCIDALFVRTHNCSFTASKENSSPLLSFLGSDCRISRCHFETKNPEALSIYYAEIEGNIAINSYIIDSEFTGVGKGISIGDRSVPKGTRPEGLKINGNKFTNTGSSQIIINEILHMDIAGNTMSGCSGSAIVLRCHGYGPGGVYISNNKISSAFAGITAEDEDFINNIVDYPSISSIYISNNVFEGGEYGFYSELRIRNFAFRDNYFTDHSKAGIYSKNPARIIVTSNIFDETKGYSLNITLEKSAITSDDLYSVIINGNTLGDKNKVSLAGGSNIIQPLP